jgi:hypothetical protein
VSVVSGDLLDGELGDPAGGLREEQQEEPGGAVNGLQLIVVEESAD